MSVDKVSRVRHGRGGYSSRGGGRGSGSSSKNFSRKKLFCPECHLLGQKLNLDVNYDHSPGDCPRLGASANLVLAEEEDLEDETDFTGNVNIFKLNHSNLSSQMNSEVDPEFLSSNSYSSHDCNQFEFYNKILRLEQRVKNGCRKEYSPQIRTKIGNVPVDATVDEGSELNCIDSSIAAKCYIKYKPIELNAMAAGSNLMKILGVVSNDVVLDVYDTKSQVKITLKNAVVVKNLGSDILIGEPAKYDNNIVTFPREKLIQLQDVHHQVIKLPYHSRRGHPGLHYQSYRVKTPTTLYPGQELKILIPPSMQCKKINVTFRRDCLIAKPVLRNTKKGHVSIKNASNKIVTIPKNMHVADLRMCTPVAVNEINLL